MALSVISPFLIQVVEEGGRTSASEPSRVRGRVGAGVAAKFTYDLTGFADHRAFVSQNDREHAVETGLRLRF